MVFDVPAESGGALSILNDFYNEIMKYGHKDIKWYFVLSTPKFQNTDKINVLRFEWVKKSWFHRLYFDNITAPRLVKKYKIDKILSFQNMTINRTNVEQIVYIHQSLPFVDYKFSITENLKLWIYQNIIGKKIIDSVKRANKVIVQTDWMKSACMSASGVNEQKVSVVPPSVNILVEDYFIPEKQSFRTFFYPSGGSIYKNHRIIIETCKKLKEKNITEYEFLFTLKGDENSYIESLKSECEKHGLPIKFLGNLDRGTVYKYYTKSILVFPSYIETYGLPLLEARLHKGIIFASNLPFANEVLKGYNNVYFFDSFNVTQLYNLLVRAIESDIIYDDVEPSSNKKSIRLIDLVK